MRPIAMVVVMLAGFSAPRADLQAEGAPPPPPPPQRHVDGSTLYSDRLPEIAVRVDPAFRHLGRFPFRIRDVAAGERFVFVDTAGGDPGSEDGERVERLFIFQFEGFLPDNELTFNYSFDDAETLGGHRFRHNVYAFSMAASRQRNPEGEAALTGRFLAEHGLRFEDEWMMSRFLTVPDAERRHELILFYVELVASTGHRLDELYDGDRETELWRRLGAELTARSREAFEILEP